MTGEVKLALVKEFRSPVNNAQGFVYELPSGSAAEEGVNPQTAAQHELEEETGLVIEDCTRFRFVGERQIGATLSSHKATVYAVELSDTELAQLEAACERRTVFGAGGSEQTYVVVASLPALRSIPLDYATLGMVYEAIGG